MPLTQIEIKVLKMYFIAGVIGFVLMASVGCSSTEVQRERICRASCEKCENIVLECRDDKEHDRTEVTGG